MYKVTPILEGLRPRKTSKIGGSAYYTQKLQIGVFAVGRKPPILEFLRIVRRPSDFGGFAAGAEPPKSE